MSGLACAKCFKFFRVKKMGVAVEEGMPIGYEEDDKWQSYKLWMADLCECPGCGALALVGFGHNPVREHYQPGYQDARAALQPIGRIDDCGGKRP
jgi:hypothetical protein